MAATRRLKEPPPSRAGKYERRPWPEHVKMVKQLQRRPGEWIKLRSYEGPNSATVAAGFARRVRSGQYLAFREGRYNALIRGSDVWAVYLGE